MGPYTPDSANMKERRRFGSPQVAARFSGFDSLRSLRAVLVVSLRCQYVWMNSATNDNYTLRIKLFHRKRISPAMLFWEWDWDHQSYSREGSGFLGIYDYKFKNNTPCQSGRQSEQRSGKEIAMKLRESYYFTNQKNMETLPTRATQMICVGLHQYRS